MCGLVALCGPAGGERERVQRGIEAIRHRGPDGMGIWSSPCAQLTLGHARLALVDRQGGQQPLIHREGSLIAVVNGEFYDDGNIRRDLQARGHQFRTASDSELLIHLYEAYGEACLSYLNGEFSFVLWDARRGEVLAVRDRFGIKPLVWGWIDGSLAIASEAKALLAVGLSPRWNERSLLHAFSHQYLPQGGSLFAGIQQVAPGSLLRWRDGRVTTHRWWRLDTGDGDLHAASREASDEDLAQELSRRLSRAVQRRLRAERPVSCALSGGIDSAAVVALASEHQGPMDCFSVCFSEVPYDEREAAGAVAEHLQARWHPVPVSQWDLLEALPQAVAASESLAINGQLPAKHMLNQAVRRAGFSVILTGEGSDECLLGYPHLRRDAGLDDGGSAAICRGVLLGEGDPALSASAKQKLGFLPAFLSAKLGIGDRLRPHLRPDALEALADWDPVADYLVSVEDELQATDPPAQCSADLWTRTCLSDYILRALGDGAEMASSVEGRTPFLDHEVFSWVRSLPMELRLRPGIDKALLRTALADRLPAATCARPKQPFLAPPITRFADAPCRDRIFDMLSSDSARTLPWLDARSLRDWLHGLDRNDARAQQAAEPACMLALSAIALHTHYGMSS